jgi:hypothetical protein
MRGDSDVLCDLIGESNSVPCARSVPPATARSSRPPAAGPVQRSCTRWNCSEAVRVPCRRVVSSSNEPSANTVARPPASG